MNDRRGTRGLKVTRSPINHITRGLMFGVALSCVVAMPNIVAGQMVGGVSHACTGNFMDFLLSRFPPKVQNGGFTTWGITAENDNRGTTQACDYTNVNSFFCCPPPDGSRPNPTTQPMCPGGFAAACGPGFPSLPCSGGAVNENCCFQLESN